MNPLSGLLGIGALVSYVVIYTPLKRVTPFAVFVEGVSRGYSANAGLGGCYRRNERTGNCSFPCSVYVAISAFLGTCLDT
ncbi:MAG: hypothetical protein R2850_10140 [Bacteroidia bacterium]